jgi:hypothetical protein
VNLAVLRAFCRARNGDAHAFRVQAEAWVTGLLARLP